MEVASRGQRLSSRIETMLSGSSVSWHENHYSLSFLKFFIASLRDTTHFLVSCDYFLCSWIIRFWFDQLELGKMRTKLNLCFGRQFKIITDLGSYWDLNIYCSFVYEMISKRLQNFSLLCSETIQWRSSSHFKYSMFFRIPEACVSGSRPEAHIRCWPPAWVLAHNGNILTPVRHS